jgi:hypothetical protein
MGISPVFTLEFTSRSPVYHESFTFSGRGMANLRRLGFSILQIVLKSTYLTAFYCAKSTQLDNSQGKLVQFVAGKVAANGQ